MVARGPEQASNPAQPEASTVRRMSRAKNTIMNEVSNIPAGGMTLRTGRRTGSGSPDSGAARAAVVGPMVRTTLGRGADMPVGSSRAGAGAGRAGAGAGSGAPYSAP